MTSIDTGLVGYPAVGLGYGSNLLSLGSHGNYWSSTPYSGDTYGAWYLRFGSDDFYRDYFDRIGGHSVRPVRGFAK